MRRILQEGTTLAPLGVRKPSGRVRVDWGNPITADMVDCLVFNEGAGPPINLATPVVTVNTSSPTWAMTGDGPAGYATGGSSFDVPDHGNVAAGDNTIRVRAKIISWPSSFTILFDKAPNGVQQRELSVFFDTSGNVDFYSVGGTAGASVSIATGLMPGAVYDFAMVTASGTTTFYVNGVSKGSSSAGNGTAGAGSSSFLSFGRNISTGGNNANAQYITAQVWTRALSAGELTYLASNPFGFLTTSGGEMPALPTVAAPPATGTISHIFKIGSGGFPVALDPTKTFLVDQSANPCFALGDDAFGLVTTLTAAQIELYLSDRASRGINILWWAPVDNIYSPSPPANANGDSPFSGGNFVGMSSQTAYWNFVDYVMQRCLAYGITVAFNPAFIGLNSGVDGWGSAFWGASSTVLQGYASFLGARYGGYPNIIWLPGGDADPNVSGCYAGINTFAVALKAADTGKHLMMIEAARFSDVIGAAPNGGYSSVDALTLALGSVPSWLDINWVYQTQSTVLSGAQRCYSQGYPCFLGEAWYELENSTTSLSLRGEDYFSILGGCTLGYMFGNGAIWPFNSPNSQTPITTTPTWQSQLSSQGSTDFQRMGALFRSREWQKLVPDISNVVMTSGSSNGSACGRTSDGQSIIVYIPSSQTITINMAKITDSGSQANCNWYDPTNGAVTNIGTFANSGSKNFTTPGNNNLGAADWVLVIDSHAAGLRTPGT